MQTGRTDPGGIIRISHNIGARFAQGAKQAAEAVLSFGKKLQQLAPPEPAAQPAKHDPRKRPYTVYRGMTVGGGSVVVMANNRGQAMHLARRKRGWKHYGVDSEGGWLNYHVALTPGRRPAQ